MKRLESFRPFFSNSQKFCELDQVIHYKDLNPSDWFYELDQLIHFNIWFNQSYIVNQINQFVEKIWIIQISFKLNQAIHWKDLNYVLAWYYMTVSKLQKYNFDEVSL